MKEKEQIKFSIIIPNYNKEEYVRDTLDSVFNQTYKNIEVIVVDDGSTDNSINIINEYNVKLLHTNRKRAGGARNIGIDNASGDYLIFLDSDDYFSNDQVIEKLASTINNQDLIFLAFTRDKFGNVYDVIEEHEDISKKIENTKYLGCPTKCFKKSLLDNIRFPEEKRYEDIIFTLEAMCKAESYGYFDESFFTYRSVPNSNVTSEISSDTMVDILEELIKIYRLCTKYPKYKINLLNRIKKDRLNIRLDVLNHLIEFDENKFFDYFN